MSAALPLLGSADIHAARTLIESENLRFETAYDELVGVFEAGNLIGCGARHGRVLKMLVVHAEHRGGSVLGEIITALMQGGAHVSAGSYFIFTKPCAIGSFESLNFRLLVKHPSTGIGMLECGSGLNQFLRDHGQHVRPGANGAVVINADPFSRGHLHLIETAAAQVNRLYVFVPSEGDFTFASDTRMALTRRGCEHLENVIVLGAGPYVLNAATFPGYFLKPGQSKDQLRLEMDMELFARYVAPFFHVATRFVGAEPLDPTTRAHNPTMRRCLAGQDIRLVEIPRAKVGDLWINTQHVRRAVAAGEIERVKEFMPQTTYDYLRSLSDIAVVSNYGADR